MELSRQEKIRRMVSILQEWSINISDDSINDAYDAINSDYNDYLEDMRTKWGEGL